MDVTERLRGLEHSLQTSALRSNRAAAGLLLAEEFEEIGSSGQVYSKAELLDALAAEEGVEIAMDGFAARQLGATVALVTYRAKVRRVGLEEVDSRRSSVWIVREGRWQMLHHQGTVVAGTRISE